MLSEVCYRFALLQARHRSSPEGSPNGVCLMLAIASCNIYSSVCSGIFSVICTFDQMYKQRNIVGVCKGEEKNEVLL